MLLTGRTVQEVSFAVVWVVGAAVLIDRFRPQRIGRVMSYVTSQVPQKERHRDRRRLGLVAVYDKHVLYLMSCVNSVVEEYLRAPTVWMTALLMRWRDGAMS